MNILVIRMGNIGDVLMTTPLIRALHRKFPGSAIDFMTSPAGRSAVANNPYLRKIFVYKKTKKFFRYLENKILNLRIRQRKYEMCFVVERDALFKKIAFDITGAGCVRIGFSGDGGQWLDHQGDFSYERHCIENYLALVKDFCGVELKPDDVLMDFRSRQMVAGERARSGIEGKYVLLHPGTTEYLPYRGWMPERFAQLIPLLKQRGFKIVLTGQRVHEPLLDDILKHCPAGDRDTVHRAVDRSFEDLAGLIRDASAVVCSDTGVLHLARALQVPVVGLFGPSNPSLTGSIGAGKHRVIRNHFPCGPCNYSVAYRYEDKKNCLDGKIPPCMGSITAAQVQEKLEEILF